MKRRRNGNRALIYFSLLLFILGIAGIIFFTMERRAELVYACCVVMGVIAAAVFRFLAKDGKLNRKIVYKEEEKNKLIFSMVPELFTEERRNGENILIEGDPGDSFGIDKGDMNKDEFLSHILPEDMEKYNMTYRQVLAGAEVATASIRWKNRPDSYLWCEYHMTAIRDENRIATKIIGVLVNSDRKLKEKLKSQRIFQAMSKVYTRVLFWDLNADYYEYLKSDELVFYNYDKTGVFSKINKAYIENYVYEGDREALSEIMSKEYIKDNVSEGKPSVMFQYRKKEKNPGDRLEWEVTEIVLLAMEEEKATQVLVTIRDMQESERIR